MSNLKDDALDLKVLAHINGIDEVIQSMKNFKHAMIQLEEAIEALSVEMEVE